MADQPKQELPTRVYIFGMGLFLATLTMLFGASMIGYALIRVRLANPPEASQITALPHGALSPPNLLWLSTVVILASSVTVHFAVSSLRSGKLEAFHKGLVFTLVLALGFVAVQTPAMIQLLNRHWEHAKQDNHLFGFVFFLILVHALHVLGGLIALSVITERSRRGVYSPQRDGPVRCLGYYWHFLDAVWVVMFAVFMVLR